MLRQGLKTVNPEFIRTRALSQLSFVHSRRYATLFPRLRLSLTLMPKSKKTLETSLNLTPSFKTSVDARVEGLVLNVDYLENCCRNFIQMKCGKKKDVCRVHVPLSLDYNFSFCTDF